LRAEGDKGATCWGKTKYLKILRKLDICTFVQKSSGAGGGGVDGAKYCLVNPKFKRKKGDNQQPVMALLYEYKPTNTSVNVSARAKKDRGMEREGRRE